MAKVIASANQKGGTGKTALIASLGSYLAAAGKKILLVELDPQLSLNGFIEKHFEVIIQGLPGVVEAFKNQLKDSSAILPIAENLFFLPGSRELSSIENSAPTIALTRFLSVVKDDFDYILIDTQGSWTPLVQAAFQAVSQEQEEDSIILIPFKSSSEDVEKAIATFHRAEIYGVKRLFIPSDWKNNKKSRELLEDYGEVLEGNMTKAFMPNYTDFSNFTDTTEKLNGQAKSKKAIVESIRNIVTEITGEKLLAEVF